MEFKGSLFWVLCGMSGVKLYLLVLVDGLEVLVELLADLTGVLAEVGLGVVLQALLVELALEVLEGKSIAINPLLDLDPQLDTPVTHFKMVISPPGRGS